MKYASGVLYRVDCVYAHADPREMQDSDEFLRLLLDFLDGELRAVATGIPLQKALMLQAMPRRLDTHPSGCISEAPSSPSSWGLPTEGAGAASFLGSTRQPEQQIVSAEGSDAGTPGALLQVYRRSHEEAPQQDWGDAKLAPVGATAREGEGREDVPGCGDLPTLFSVFFEGETVVACGVCTVESS